MLTPSNFTIHHPLRMGASEQDQLVGRLFAVYDALHDGDHSQDEFGSYVLTNCAYSRVGELLDDTGQTVGWSTLHLHHVSHEGRDWYVYRSGVSAFPGHRYFRFMVLLAVRSWVVDRARFPLARMAVAGQSGGPLIYLFFRKNDIDLYPRPDGNHPQEVERLREALLEQFGEQPFPGGSPWQVEAFSTIRSAFVHRPNPHPAIGEYLQMNPDFERGAALFFIVPLTARNFYAACWSLARTVYGGFASPKSR